MAKEFRTVLIHQEEFCNSELFQGHSGRNLIDFTVQDTVLILDNFFLYIDHV